MMTGHSRQHDSHASPTAAAGVTAPRRRRKPRPLAGIRAGIRAGVLPCGLLAGCTETASAPAVPFLGAFFPSWLLSALIGIVIAIVVRVAFVRIGLDDVLPVRLLVYMSVAVLAGFLVSAFLFGR